MEIGWSLLGLVICAITKECYGEVDISIQLLTYTNPTFGLAQDSLYCAYQSPTIPPPPTLRATLPSIAGQQQTLQAPAQPQQQQSPVNQQYPQNQQYFQNQMNQQNQPMLPYQQNQANQYQQPQQPQQAQYPQIQNGQYQQQQQQRLPYQQQNQAYAPYRQQQNQQNLFQQYQPAQAQSQAQAGQQNQLQGTPLQQNQQQQYQQYLANQQEQQLPRQQPAGSPQSQNSISVQQCLPQQTDFTVPNWNQCRFSFSAVFATLDDAPFVVSTGLIPIPSANATIDFTQPGWIDQCTWGNCEDRTWRVPFNRTFKLKPNVIEIVVTHFGDSVYGSANGYTPMGYGQAHLVDSVTVNIAKLIPASATVNPPPVYSICVNGDQKSAGYPLSTLTLTLTARCKSGFYGQFCNLTNCTSFDNQTQICLSTFLPGQSFVCSYDHATLQPINCTMCPHGVTNGQCHSSDSTSDSNYSLVVGYVVGLIILAILLAIAVAVIIIGFFTYRTSSDRQPSRRPPQQAPQQSSSHSWVPSILSGTKARNQNGNGGQTRGGYTTAPTEEQREAEWPPTQRTPTQPPVYSVPHAARPTHSNGSTPEHNGPRREAAV